MGSVAGFRHEVRNVWDDGDALITELDVHYTRLDGREVTVPCCNVFVLRQGSVAEYRSYIDATPSTAEAVPSACCRAGRGQARASDRGAAITRIR